MPKSAAFRKSISARNSKSIPDDDFEYAERCEYWDGRFKARHWKYFNPPRRIREATILTGHGASLRIDRGTLHIRNGFTHFPQRREEYRLFPGDINLPSRIILVDCSGSISLDVIAWFGEQNVPLIQVDWRGEILAVFARTGYCADEKVVAKQLMNLKRGNSLRIARGLVSQKIANSIETVRNCAPRGYTSEKAISQMTSDVKLLNSRTAISSDMLLGIEGRAAAHYFGSFVGVPIKWTSERRKPIPPDWHRIGRRLSAISGQNKNARHPVNAMLNYAYAVSKAQLKIHLLAEGYDPRIGLLHRFKNAERDNLVLDLFEPMRPVVDRVLFEMVRENEFAPADFSITKEGVCRLNPQMARRLVRLVGAS